MKCLNLIWMLSFAILLHAQEPSDTNKIKKRMPILMQIGAGPNLENRSTPDDMGYGVHLAENSLKMGFYAVWGARIIIKEKFDLSLQFVYRTLLRDKGTFHNSFANLFPDKEVIHYYKISNPSCTGFRFSFAYIFKLKSICIAPKICVGAMFGPQVSYDYVLRTPGANYFDRYQVQNRAKAEYPISIGFNISLINLKWLELTGEFGGSKNQNIYKVYNIAIDEPFNEPADEIFYINRTRLFFSLGLNFNIDT